MFIFDDIRTYSLFDDVIGCLKEQSLCKLQTIANYDKGRPVVGMIEVRFALWIDGSCLAGIL